MNMHLKIARDKPPKDTDWLKVPSPILIIGSAFNGKSEFALSMLDQKKPAVVFGTAELEGTDLSERIKELKTMRPPSWQTLENNFELIENIEQLEIIHQQVLFDSVSHWVASRLVKNSERYSMDQIHQQMEHEFNRLYQALKQHDNKRIVLVTNEVGAGVTPPRPVAQLFRRMVSKVNCRVADLSRTVVLISAGIPIIIKQQG